MPTNNPSVHYLGIVGFGALDGSHALCEAQWERIKGERASEYGPDGAYNHGLCDPHGIRMNGRGWNRDSAANGQQGGVDYNPGSRALCVLVGTDDPISTLCQQGIAQWASEAVEAHGKEWPLKGHSDFVATMCPGDHLRDFIAKFNAGQFKPPSPAPITEDEPMPILITSDPNQGADTSLYDGFRLRPVVPGEDQQLKDLGLIETTVPRVVDPATMARLKGLPQS